MIIEIKDLPHGRKVKHINVDITFEEDGGVVVNASSDTQPSISTRNFPESPIDPKDPIDHQETQSESPSDIERPVISEDRPKKEVPSEMLDLEF